MATRPLLNSRRVRCGDKAGWGSLCSSNGFGGLQASICLQKKNARDFDPTTHPSEAGAPATRLGNNAATDDLEVCERNSLLRLDVLEYSLSHGPDPHAKVLRDLRSRPGADSRD